MPLTFIEIEKQKSWRISVLFFFLLFIYFSLALALMQVLYCVFSLKAGFVLFNADPLKIVIVTAFVVSLAVVHFWFSAYNAVYAVSNTLNAFPPDPEDAVHMRLKNIMEEIQIVTGNKRQIKCLVIPSLSMNALAAADMKGEAVIGITEGLLSRLTRPQLEAVMAHEAYHILSGDCLETTVAASLFGIYASALEDVKNAKDEDPRALPVFLFLWVMVKLSQMLSMFISREREYRADAGAVRMTRNPMAMAEALHMLSRNWTGSGLISSGLEMLCIVNPVGSELDESEGWWADLISTHPPIRKRMDILLKMTRVRLSDLDKEAYSKAEALTDTTISADQTEKGQSEIHCPACKHPLFEISYEKTKVYRCKNCRGVLVGNDKISRIVARREVPCTDRIKSLAKAVVTDNQRKLTINKLRSSDTRSKSVMSCPKCRNVMFRKFYSLAYLLEIDRCNICGITWFDIDELEMLQCIIENKITAEIKL